MHPNDRRSMTVDLETPALLLDLDAMERNLQSMSAFFHNRAAKLRPHFKAHQSVALASRQIQAGAIGITCARLSHAEALVRQGIRSILIASEIAGVSMIERFVELSRRGPVIVAVDNEKVVCDMATLARDQASALNVVVDVNLGLNRCGVPPGKAALTLAKVVLEKGLRFRGLMGYRGNLQLPAGPEKQRLVSMAMQILVDTKALIEHEGIPIEIVSSGGTTDYSIVGAFPGITEVQAGGYLVMDSWKTRFASDFTPALTVLATVISKGAAGTIVVDAGIKAMSGSKGLPSVKDFPGLEVKKMYAEHSLIEVLEPAASLDVGDKIEMWVTYVDATISRYRQMYGVRGGVVESVVAIEE
jgi:D-serine deaminase-like pyridoxal phosphate-dependent protein